MINSLDELISHIRATVPHSGSIHDVCYQPALDGLTFKWFGNGFFAKNNCEVFELRGKTLYVTGNSLLLQSLIAYVSDRQKALEELALALDKAEELLGRPRHFDQGLQVLQKARASLTKFVAQPVHPANGDRIGTPIARV